MQVWLCAALTPPLLYAVLIALSAVWTRLRVPGLPAPRPLARTPRLSIIVPACNEESTLEAALRAKLASDYPDFEIVLVDDRSTDRTGTIADRLAAEDARLRVVHVTELPAGWLGKVHALHRGALAATGELLLFSDADVVFSPQLLASSVAALERDELDFIALLPHITSSTFMLDVALSTFFRLLITGGRLWKMREPRSRVAVGAGIFNLVRRSIFERSPGFEWIRMEVADDIAFGQMIKKAGARCAVFDGHADVKLAYYATLGEFVRGLEKNSYAISGYRPLFAALVMFLVFYFEIAPALVLPFATGPALVMALTTLALVGATQAACAVWIGRPVISAIVPVFGPLMFLLVSLRAVLLAHARGGIVWRGTFYSLAALRQGTRLERF